MYKIKNTLGFLQVSETKKGFNYLTTDLFQIVINIRNVIVAINRTPLANKFKSNATLK
jgi:hypothetical protein